MSRSKRIEQIVKLGQEGQVPLPFSYNVISELPSMDEPADLKAITEIPATSVDTLRRAKDSDYKAIGMTLPIVLNIDNNSQFENQNNIEDDVIRDNISSPSLLDSVDKLHASHGEKPVASPLMDLYNLINTTSSADKENNPPNSEDERYADIDFSPDDSTDEYQPPQRRHIRNISFSPISNTSSSTVGFNSEIRHSPTKTKTKKGKKRIRNPQKWKKNISKELKNSGKEYVSRTGKNIDAKVMRPPCNCRLQCRNQFSEDQRRQIFESYWNLASIQRQRDFLCSCIEPLNILCRRIKNVEKPRTPNCSFLFLNNGRGFKMCKTFLLNTLGISERTLRTVIEAKKYNSGMAPKDNRGKHGHHKKTDPEILQSVKNHINSIPRIESHYLRAHTSIEFIDGGLTIVEMHRNYKTQRSSLQKEAATYDVYAKFFNTEFNLTFFIPKKDQCDLF
ncbi:unnamed protein product [Parnassius apollo]|uniref:(apollo) hypothetical protein n=1 Tax=Parnassius apollo TaxID=110799 RepID=A0A8S3X8N2_PARAO|nr:unnamed protein product [Parnassius apollo]